MFDHTKANGDLSVITTTKCAVMKPARGNGPQKLLKTIGVAAAMTLGLTTLATVPAVADEPEFGGWSATIQVAPTFPDDAPYFDPHFRATLVDALTLKPVSVSERWGYDAFELQDVPAGSYKLRVRPDDPHLLEQWYRTAGDPADASVITVLNGQTRRLGGLDLRTGGMVSGTVSVPKGQSYEEVVVLAIDEGGAVTSSTGIGPDGSYLMVGLPTGSYRIKFGDRVWSQDSNIMPLWFPGTTRFDEAVAVNVVEGEEVAGIDAKLLVGGKVSGAVQIPTGVDADELDMEVEAYGDNQQLLSSTWVKDDLSYEISSLPPGPVRLKLAVVNGGVASQWYDAQDDFDSAKVVDVAPSTPITADFLLAKAGTIKGTVSAVEGAEGDLAALRMCPVGETAAAPDADDCTNVGEDGEYSLTGLQPGSYRLHVFTPGDGDSGLASQWYGGESSQSQGDLVSVGSGETVEADFLLTMGAMISGIVNVQVPTDFDRPFSFDGPYYVEVIARNPDGEQVGFACVGNSGRYEVNGMPPGTYTLEARPSNGQCDYEPVAVPDAAQGSLGDSRSDSVWESVSAAQSDDEWEPVADALNAKVPNLVPSWYGGDMKRSVTVNTGQYVLRKNITMVQGGVATGTVTLGADLRSAEGSAAQVRVYDASDSSSPIRETTVRLGGSFNISGLPTGRELKFEFVPLGIEGAHSQWFSRAAAFEEARSVVLEPESITGRINVAFSSQPVPPAPTVPNQPIVNRIAGASRYLTNLAVNEEAPVFGAPVFVATGSGFADALSVAPAVRALGGSLVLTSKNSIDKRSLGLISAISPSAVYVIGGSNAVSNKVVSSLKSATGEKPQRVAGATRYETSEKILTTFFGDKELGGVFVATGRAYPDALSASAAGGALTMPVVLVDGKRAQELSAVVQSFLIEHGAKDIQLVGGTGAVNGKLEANLREAGRFETVNRLAGPNRFATNDAVNGYVSDQRPDTAVTGIWLATGMNFPDALSASVPAGNPTQRLVLSKKNCIPKPVVTDWIRPADSMVSAVNLVGGTTVLEAPVFQLKQCY